MRPSPRVLGLIASLLLACEGSASPTEGRPAPDVPAATPTSPVTSRPVPDASAADAPAATPPPSVPDQPTPPDQPTTRVRPTPELHRHKQDGKTLFHFALELETEDLLVSGPMMERELAYQFAGGGQFEIYLPSELIPVPSPDCAQGITVRMPWTNPKSKNAASAVEGKRELYSQLIELREGSRATRRVIVELNPYVEVAPDDPKSVSLTRCTVFFRHANKNEAYVDELSP